MVVKWCQMVGAVGVVLSAVLVLFGSHAAARAPHAPHARAHPWRYVLKAGWRLPPIMVLFGSHAAAHAAPCCACAALLSSREGEESRACGGESEYLTTI